MQEQQRHGEREQAGDVLLGVEREPELAEDVGGDGDRGAGQRDRQHVRQLGHSKTGIKAE
jgi:hypothetical protein